MQFIHLNDEAIRRGRTAFRQYMAAVLSGPANEDTYVTGMWRQTGAQSLVGVIQACIEHGIDGESDIVHAASRVTRCRTTTVKLMLAELTGDDPARHLWCVRNGVYGSHRAADYPRILIAA